MVPVEVFGQCDFGTTQCDVSKTDHLFWCIRRIIGDQSVSRRSGGLMAQCTACGTQTALHVNGQPLCPSCDEQHNGKINPVQSKTSLAPIDQPSAFDTA